MATIEIIKAERSHVDTVAQSMRQSDRDEIWASSLTTPYEALDASLSFSPMAWTATLDGVPFCMFGVAAASPLCKHGIPWMLGSPQIEKNAVGFLRRSKACLTNVTQHYKVLSNYVDARNLTAIRWLKWMGFTLRPPIPHGPFNLLFHPFEFKESVTCVIRFP